MTFISDFPNEIAQVTFHKSLLQLLSQVKYDSEMIANIKLLVFFLRRN